MRSFKNPPGFHLIFSKWGSSYVGTGCPVLATFFRHFPSPLSSLSSTTNILRGFQANTNLLSRLPHPPFKTTNGRKKLITSLAPGPISHKFQRLYRTRQTFSTVRFIDYFFDHFQEMVFFCNDKEIHFETIVFFFLMKVDVISVDNSEN